MSGGSLSAVVMKFRLLSLLLVLWVQLSVVLRPSGAMTAPDPASGRGSRGTFMALPRMNQYSVFSDLIIPRGRSRKDGSARKQHRSRAFAADRVKAPSWREALVRWLRHPHSSSQSADPDDSGEGSTEDSSSTGSSAWSEEGELFRSFTARDVALAVDRVRAADARVAQLSAAADEVKLRTKG
jgi:hypothetical protein